MATTPLVWLALRAIAFYQRHLSPRKGYCCALHATGGGRSCSAYGYRAIARGGVRTGLVLLRRRFDACARAAAPPRMRISKRHQRGDCDMGDCSGCLDAGDALDCVSDRRSCDRPWKRRAAVRPEANLDDHLNNEKALRERIRQAQEWQRP